MSWTRSKSIPIAITLVCGVLVSLDYFIGIPVLANISDTLQVWAVVLAGFTILVGMINTISYHVRNIQNQAKGKWIYSAILIIFLGLQVVSGLVDFKNLNNPVYKFLSTSVYSPLAAAAYSILGIWILTAAYRSIRAKTLESSIMMITAIIVFMGNAPIGAVIWPGFPVLKDWLLNVLGSSGTRGILLGAGIGGILLTIRVLLGYERRYLGVG